MAMIVVGSTHCYIYFSSSVVIRWLLCLDAVPCFLFASESTQMMIMSFVWLDAAGQVNIVIMNYAEFVYGGVLRVQVYLPYSSSTM